jgi:hypothetical protein
MANKFGAIEIPVQPSQDGPASDPALEFIAQFVMNVMNAYTLEAWRTVDPKGRPCKTYFTHDPQECEVDDRKFPCVFVWRSGSAPDCRADDYVIDMAEISILWLFEPLPQHKDRLHRPFFNGLKQPLLAAFARGRSPAWSLPDDASPGAATRGTVLWGRCGFLSQKVKTARLEGITVEMVDGNGSKLKPYDGIKFIIEAEERLFEDPAVYARSIGGPAAPAPALSADLINPATDLVRLRAVENPPEEAP